MKLALGPILEYWPRNTVLAFYRAVLLAPVDTVYLGETVCSRRHEMRLDDWLDVADMLSAGGKEVILSTQVLIESESELKTLRRIIGSGHTIEANDMGAVRLLAGHARFVAGASLNIYNRESLAFVAALGAKRWVPPLEIPHEAIAALHAERPEGMETEVFVYGRLPLAYSARCFTARRFNLQKDSCGFRCIDFPEGLPVRTREHKTLFVLNGVQTQSARVCNLIRELQSMARAGIAGVRISPSYAYIVAIAELFRRAIDTPDEAQAAALELERLTAGDACDGFWHAQPGMTDSRAAIAQ